MNASKQSKSSTKTTVLSNVNLNKGPDEKDTLQQPGLLCSGGPISRAETFKSQHSGMGTRMRGAFDKTSGVGHSTSLQYQFMHGAEAD